MICESQTRKYCCEDISKIENYDKAIADSTQMWECHHKAEILPCGKYSIEDLEKFDLYWKQPADRLIFLDGTCHRQMHAIGRKHSKETCEKISKAHQGYTPIAAGWNKGIKMPFEFGQKQAIRMKGNKCHLGKKHSNDTKKKISEEVSKRRWNQKRIPSAKTCW